MTQKDLCEKVSSLLRATGYTKRVPVSKRWFTITDQKGISRKFSVQDPPQQILFTPKDIEMILHALSEVIRASLRVGERVRIANIGTFFSKFQEEHVNYDPSGQRFRIIKERYVPKFSPSKNLKESVKDYAKYLHEMQLDELEVFNTNEEDEFYDEYDDFGFEEELPEDEIDGYDGEEIQIESEVEDDDEEEWFGVDEDGNEEE